MKHQPLPEQIEAVSRLHDWYTKTSQKFFHLSGDAGTSKTTTFLMWLEEACSSYLNPHDVTITAPISELVSELSDRCRLPIQVQTIHSLLGFRPVATPIEEQMLKKKGVKDIQAKLVILDEAPYTSPIIIHDLSICYPNVRWLLVGDQAQLKSIGTLGTKDCQTLDDLKRNSGFFHLKKNLRAVNPRQEELCADVREHGRHSKLLWENTVDPIDGLTLAKEYVKNYLSLPDADHSQLPSKFVAIAYRKTVVSQLAAQLRRSAYGYKPSDPLQPGELIRLGRVIGPSGETLVNNNEVVKVQNYCPEIVVVERLEASGFAGEVVALDIDHTGELESLYVQADKEKHPSAWAKYHDTKLKYADIRSILATTAHSCQGRTVDHALVDITDVLKADDKALLYVAVSRCRQLGWFMVS